MICIIWPFFAHIAILLHSQNMAGVNYVVPQVELVAYLIWFCANPGNALLM